MVIRETDEEHFVYDACIPVPESHRPDDAELITLPAVDVATATYDGDLGDLNLMAHTVIGWIAGKGGTLEGPVRVELQAVRPFFGDTTGEIGTAVMTIQMPYRPVEAE